MKNSVAFILCLIGGIMMIYADVSVSVGIWADLIAFAASLAPEIADILFWILLILQNIATLGGVAVIAGAFLLTTNRVGTGKFIIGIASGMGIIGLVILVYNMYMASGAEAFMQIYNLLSSSIGFLGVVLTIVGRMTAKKPE
jgi:hypothetical protein